MFPENFKILSPPGAELWQGILGVSIQKPGIFVCRGFLCKRKPSLPVLIPVIWFLLILIPVIWFYYNIWIHQGRLQHLKMGGNVVTNIRMHTTHMLLVCILPHYFTFLYLPLMIFPVIFVSKMPSRMNMTVFDRKTDTFDIVYISPQIHGPGTAIEFHIFL